MENLQAKLRHAGYGSELAAGAALVIWPEQVWVAWILFTAGLVLIFWPFIEWLFESLNLPWVNGYIPLTEASRIAYEETYQSLAERFAEQMGTTPLEWYASALVTNNDLPFFGIKPYQTIVREIPSEEKIRCHISIQDGTSYLKRHGEEDPIYTDLHMKKRDLKKQINEIKSWG